MAARVRCAFGVATVAALLSGCASAPGVSFGEAFKPKSEAGVLNTGFLFGRAKPAGAVAPAAASPMAGASATASAAGDAAPAGALTRITPDLIEQLRVQQKAKLSTEVQRLFTTFKPYTIGVGDVLSITVWGHPELALRQSPTVISSDPLSQSGVSDGYNVSPEGLVQFPLVGTVKVSGLSENDARTELTNRLAKYLKNPQVTVRILAYRAGRVYVEGEVRTPGQQAVNDMPMTLPEVLSRAGGLTATADRAAVSISRGDETTVINLPQLAELGINPSRVMLAAGDLVRVASRDEAKVYVLGEVTRPIVLSLRNGRLSLNDALGESGGVNSTSGDPKQVYIIRTRGGATQDKPSAASLAANRSGAVFHLDASTPVAYVLAEGFELKAGDVVYVDPVPVVRWNRVLSMVLPTVQGVSITRSALN